MLFKIEVARFNYFYSFYNLKKAIIHRVDTMHAWVITDGVDM